MKREKLEGRELPWIWRNVRPLVAQPREMLAALVLVMSQIEDRHHADK